jgi:OOP family OmpA-OmpF porin
MIRVITVLLASLLILSPAYAGWLSDAVKGAAERIGGNAVNEGADKAYDNATEKRNADKSENDNESGRMSSPGDEESQQAVGGTGADADVDIVSAEKVYSRYDFIPGDKTIFFDDFSDTDVGEFPLKWSLKGPSGGGNAVEVVDYKGKRFLRSVPPSSKDEGLAASTLYVRLKTKGDMPEKFTVEFDAVLGETKGYQNQYYLLMYDENGWPGAGNAGSIYIEGQQGRSANTTTSINKNDGKIHHIAVSVNGTFVKAWVDNQRVVNDPDAATRPIKYIGISLHANHGYSDTVMFTNFRVAEGGKDIKSALDTEGKIVTYGILFDTGSDKIKPESLPTLKKILAILKESPALKFSIEGHTDNQGTKKVNEPLSERRAKSVRTWLTGKGISPSRLESKGWGDAKPIDTNDTAEGRANNRRVEFIKIG